MPYIKNENILECPSGQYDYIGWRGETMDMNVDYQYNYFFSYNPRSLGSIEDPSHIIWVTEGEVTHYFRWWNEQDAGNKNHIWDYDMHNDGCNYVFMDGHAKWKSGQLVPHELYQGPWAKKDFRADPDWP